ncbi:MAG: hypothetical protein DCO95_18495 [Roseivirga sp. XM-24bin3]|nr:MAG: hypothetical protein DCO95_18495 [Roseivirga sp. XM-24bin3]
MRSVSGTNDMPGRTQRMLMERIEKQQAEVQQKMDSWYASNWNAYLNAVKAVNFSPIGSK